MTRTLGFLRQHVIAVLALTLAVGGGAAFAAGTKLPKNSVASKQVKNGSLKGKDVKDRSITGADLRDGSVAGADLANGTVEKGDLATDAVDEVQVVYYNGGGTKTLWEEAGIGKASLSLSCDPNYSINGFAAGGLSPGRAGIVGIEDVNHYTEAAGTALLVGAAAGSRLGDVGQPIPGAGFSGSKFGFGQLAMFFQTPKKDVYIDLNISQCSASGTITIDNKPEGSVIARSGARQGKVTCESSGAAYCTEPEA